MAALQAHLRARGCAVHRRDGTPLPGGRPTSVTKPASAAQDQEAVTRPGLPEAEAEAAPSKAAGGRAPAGTALADVTNAVLRPAAAAAAVKWPPGLPSTPPAVGASLRRAAGLPVA